MIRKFFLELRKLHDGANSTPITTRQLESLMRLVQARAKLELRTVATAEDASDVIEIMKVSMIDTFSDNIGAIDLNRSINGAGLSKASKKKKFVAALDMKAQRQCKDTFHVEELKEMALEIGIPINSFSELLESMNTNGYLLKQSAKVYRLLSN